MKPELITSAMWFPVSHYIRASDLLLLQMDEHSLKVQEHYFPQAMHPWEKQCKTFI
jgi:hypothetical protein